MQSPEGGRSGRTRLASIGGIESKLFHVKHRESTKSRQAAGRLESNARILEHHRGRLFSNHQGGRVGVT